MKIRTGFVSNSSSSSFVVMATKKFTKEDLKALLLLEKSAVDSVLEYTENIEYNTVVDEATDVLWGSLERGVTLGAIRAGGGEISSEGDIGEQMLYNLSEIKTKDFVFSAGN